MRIGMMLRAIDEKGGIGVYTRNLVQEMLNIDCTNQYVLFYHNVANIGRFNQYKNVTERILKAPNKAFWDQIAVPYACWQEKIDLIFHPKFTVPLLAPCKAVMVVHGADWFMPEQHQYYNRLDVQYIRTVMPWYFKKSSVVISVSQLTTENFYQALKLPPDKIKTIYFGPARHFQWIRDKSILEKVKTRYNLPDKFIFSLSRHRGEGLTKHRADSRKNLGQIFKAYARYHGQTKEAHKLVIGGKDCHLYRDEYGVPEDGYGRDILFPGWIDQIDMPAVYSLADLYLYPSNLEAFPIPITEAMACGTPIVTSNINGLKEIAGDAALLVDPHDPEAIAGAIYQVLSDVELQEKLSKKGLDRSVNFTWDKCARMILETLENLALAEGQADASD